MSACPIPSPHPAFDQAPRILGSARAVCRRKVLTPAGREWLLIALARARPDGLIPRIYRGRKGHFDRP